MPQTIMIGTTDPNITYLLQRYAQESGFETTHVCQSHDIVALAYQLQPQLIILDIELVEATEPDLLQQLKADPATQAIPIVLYSCLDEPPDDWGERVDGYLPKSVMYDDFVQVLKHARAKTAD